jgi:FkbM family methyltransferase
MHKISPSGRLEKSMMTIKQLIQSGFNTFGLRVSYNKFEFDYFFEAVKSRGFVPKHIVDVGASHGIWSRTALKYFPDAYYTLIEPQEWLQKDSNDILARGKAKWISAGAADKPGTLPLWADHHDVSSTFVHSTEHPEEHVPSEAGRFIEVPIVTLDEVVRESTAPFPDMVKIDAEGFDLKVIAGASTLLGKTDIFILEATICAPGLENTLENVLLTMTRAGYQLIDIPGVLRTKDGFGWLCNLAFLRADSPMLAGLSFGFV